jgi:hypothetical protein
MGLTLSSFPLGSSDSRSVSLGASLRGFSYLGRVSPAPWSITSFSQPDDRGTINDISVLRVTRRGAQADHFTESPLSPGSQVQVRVDWERRFDHMQQHSGKGHRTGTPRKTGRE